MNTTEFYALANDGDLMRVMITHARDSHLNISAVLVCDNESFGLTPYNYLRDSKGQIARFDYIGEAEKAIRIFGYKGPISIDGQRKALAAS